MSRNLTRILLRIFIGGILVASALGKSLDVLGFIEVLKTYRAFPDTVLGPLAYGVILVEAVVGLWVLAGLRLTESALAAGVVNAGYAMWMTVSLMRGLELANCGCFGVFFPQPLRWYSPLEDLVLVSASAVLWALARSTPGDQENRR